MDHACIRPFPKRIRETKNTCNVKTTTKQHTVTPRCPNTYNQFDIVLTVWRLGTKEKRRSDTHAHEHNIMWRPMDYSFLFFFFFFFRFCSKELCKRKTVEVKMFAWLKLTIGSRFFRFSEMPGFVNYWFEADKMEL